MRQMSVAVRVSRHTPSVSVRSARVLAAAAGVVVCAASASAQTAFTWSLLADGAWSDIAAWTPAGSPGATSPLDTAELGSGVAPNDYTVSLDVNRTIGGLAIANPNAVLAINPNRTLTINGNVNSVGTIQINSGSAFNSVLNFGPGTSASGDFDFDGPSVSDAVLNGPADPLAPVTLTASSEVEGTGTINGYVLFAGEVLAEDGDLIRLIPDDGVLAGGGAFVQNLGGDLQLDGLRAAGVVFGGNNAGLTGGETLTVGSGVLFDSPFTINLQGNTFNSLLNLEDSVTLAGSFLLNGAAVDDARIVGPTVDGQRAAIGPGATVSGTGRLDGFLDIAGTVTAQNGEVINMLLDDATLSGGGTVVQQPGGDIIWNNHLLTGITVAGDLQFDPGESIRVGSGVTFADPVVLNNGANTFNTNFSLLDGVTFATALTLNGVSADDARLNGPTTDGERATLGATSVVTGTGRLDGFLDLAGLVEVGPGEQINLLLDDATLTGGGTINQNGGDFVWNNHLATNITLAGDIVLDPVETLRVGPGVTFAGPITISNGASTFDARLILEDGVTLDADVLLDGLSSDDAIIVGTGIDGGRSFIGPNAVVVGSGELDGLLDIAGLVQAPTGSTIALRIDDSVLTGGGTVEQQPGADIIWNNHLATDITLAGDLRIDPSETLRIGTGVTFTGPITVSNGASTFNASLSVEDTAQIQADVVLNGLTPDDARLAGPGMETEAAGFGPGSSVAGRGRITGRFTAFDGTLAPGTGFGLDTIELRHATTMTFGPGAVTRIGYAGDQPGEFDRIDNTGDVVLGGALVVDALGGFEPMSDNAVVFIDGGDISGTYDSVIYNGNLEPGDVARVFYEPNAVTFAVTCNADVSLPAGVINILDVVGFINNWNAQGPGSDFNTDGFVNILDVVAYITAWNVGCPQ